MLGELALCLSSLMILTLALDPPIVNTTDGPIRGIITNYAGETVFQFKGIPFAKPPLGRLRFSKPVRMDKWTNVFNATSYGPSCIQYLFENDAWLLDNKDISENCLHLNVYVPRRIDKMVPKAIMIWIHGGGFTAGQGKLYDGSYLAVQGEVIIVTINYRVGLLGFLSTEDSNAPGNYGIWDQKMAIEWVHENAEHFGGDKDRVTIFGESAGGYSVGLHTIIPSNKGYFQRAISQSGAVYSPRALASDSKRVAIEAGTLLGCQTNNTSVLIDCLRVKLATDILKIQDQAVSGWDKTDTFVSRLGPVVDGTLIVGNPVDLLDNKDSEAFLFFQSLDIMAGTNNAEGGLMFWSMMKYQKQYNFNISEGIPYIAMCDVLASKASRSYFDDNIEVTKAICDQYSVEDGSLAEQGRRAVNVYADLQFVIPTFMTLFAHSESQIGGTYQYIFTHQPSYPWIQSRPPWLQGANHAGEVPFVFGIDAMYPKTHSKPPSELELSRQMKTYWTNFAKSGNPNSEILPDWPKFNQADKYYMNIKENPKNGRYIYSDRVKFWTEDIPAITSLLINTTKGYVHGALAFMKDSPILQFKGIPYAMPPIGRRRFAKPVPHDGWNTVYDATKFGPSCIQKLSQRFIHLLKSKNISEDCLYLNIYIPSNIKSNIKRAVMIWVHGGGYVNGQGHLYDGSYLALLGDVIVVTINYRLGILGFLSTEDDSSPGNYGLWDQKLAIKWVYDNIDAFGGDTSRITVFGESAGGYSVGIQSMIPSNEGYFQRVILESGTQLSPRAFAKDSRRVATEAGKLLNCSVDQSSVLVKCLREKDAHNLLAIQDQAAYDWDETENLAMRIGPVIDGDLIPADPTDLLNDIESKSFKFYQSLDIIAGTNSAEGGLMLPRLYKYQKIYQFNISVGIPRAVLCNVIAPSVVRTYFDNDSKISEAICNYYGTHEISLAEQSHRALDVYGDFLFIVPILKTLKQHNTIKSSRTKGHTYHYIFSHKPQDDRVFPKWFSGASHGHEVSFVFGGVAIQNQSTTEEADLSRLMMEYWSDFAKTGNPNTDLLRSLWPTFKNSNEFYMNFTISPHNDTQLYTDRVRFWMETIPNMLQKTSKRNTNSGPKAQGSILMLFITACIAINGQIKQVLL